MLRQAEQNTSRLGTMRRVRRAVALALRRGRGSHSDLDDIEVVKHSGMFDAGFYLEKYPDVQASGMDPLNHFVKHGWAEGRDPSTFFQTSFYLQNNLDVRASGMNPLRHYVEFGKAEGRTALPVDGTLKEQSSDAGSNYKIIVESGVFDPKYYLKTYPKVAPKSDAVQHYLTHGAVENKNPSKLFNTRYYLANNPDVAKSGINPLVHFCKYGRYELRDPSAAFDMAWCWVTHLAETNPAAHPLAHVQSLGAEVVTNLRAAGKLSKEDKQQAVEICMRLLERDDHDAMTATRIGIALKRWACWSGAERAFSKAVSEDWNNPKGHARLADALGRQGKWWQSVESWQTATALAPDAPADWWFRLGEAQEKMNRFAESAHAYQQALALKPTNAGWQYLLGYVAGKAGQTALSETAYARAVHRDKRPEVKAFGIGVFHQERGYWPEAAVAYEEELRKKPLSAELHFRLGMAHDRCYRWQDALAAYSLAISLNSKGKPYWHYRYGFVLERLKRWTDAAQAYAAAVSLSAKDMPYWRYRQGYVLAAAGHYEQACMAYIATRKDRALIPIGVDGGSTTGGDAGVDVVIPTLQDATVESYLAEFDDAVPIRGALRHDFTNADLHYKLGACLERREDWRGAASAYADALARSNPHRPKWYYLLGYVLFRAGRFEEACDAFRQTRIIQRPYGISQDKLAKGSAMLRLGTHYAEYLETLPVKDSVIMYDSHLGKFASCNPLAMFNYLVVHPIYRNYLHVWAIDDPARVPDAVRRMTNVAIVQRHTDLFVRYIATAKYLMSNSILPQYFVRRPEQKCLATWHGTPLKTLGKQQQYKFQEHKRAQRFFLQSTHVISPNPHTTDILLDSYDLRHIMTGKMAETGYPRVDLTLNASEERREELYKQLGVSGKRPVVLYAPTWRGTLETVSYEVERAKSDLAYLAEQHECDIIFRGHHLMEKVFGTGESLGCTVAPAIIDTNELLSVVDVLITDYSSIFFDFLATGRPVLYYIYDLEDYQRDRGLYFSMDDMPGYKCRDIESLSESLCLALQGKVPDAKHYLEAQQKFNCHDDGAATERVVDFLFNDDASHVVESGPRSRVNLLMQGGGFKRNGITTSFLNLLKHIDRSIAHITVAISPDTIEFDPECRELFDRVPEDVAIVARHGLMAMTWEERWLRGHYESSRYEFNDEQMAIIRHLFDREYQRVFGNVHFDVAVSFSGYDTLWGAILNLTNNDIRKVIYMHNDMRDEYVERFPELMRMFRLYKSADRLVGVCDESKNVNCKNLSSWLGVPADRFITSENVQDPERIVELSYAPIEARDDHLFQDGQVFVNMGRLSVEKGQGKLIRAFARLCAGRGPMRLLILGVGPLQESLQNLIEELGMTNHIHLLGLRSNPYPYLRRADCFVLSSNHEAKTMSLIENAIVGTPFVATDISGNADIKKLFPSNFFDNSEDGVFEGLLSFVEGNIPPVHFDVEQHQRLALDQFNTGVLGVGNSSVN